jgi:PIN domain nuclease of toxin-antitoxin system
VRLLIDTHLLLWAAAVSKRLPSSARKLINDPANDLYVSAASLWEIAIKSARGNPEFRVDPRLFRNNLLANGYFELPITSEHAIATYSLPPLHKDPFDRLLIAQATVEGITLLTADRQVAKYPGPIRKV